MCRSNALSYPRASFSFPFANEGAHKLICSTHGAVMKSVARIRPALLHMQRIRAFTIVEVLVATGVMCVLLTVVMAMMSQTSRLWRHSSDKIQSFQGARLAFGVVTQNLSQATLNTYLDYDNVLNPQAYLRKSELRFISGGAGVGGM